MIEVEENVEEAVERQQTPARYFNVIRGEHHHQQQQAADSQEEQPILEVATGEPDKPQVDEEEQGPEEVQVVDQQEDQEEVQEQVIAQVEAIKADEVEQRSNQAN